MGRKNRLQVRYEIEADRRATRERIVEGLASRQCRETYGIDLACTDQHRARMIDDATGDQLDALLCAVQAAWAWSRRDAGYGVPDDADLLEGWIVDPALLPA